MRYPHKWEELFPDEFFAELARAPIAYWCCGGMEEHGAHLTLGTDWISLYPVCLEAANEAGGVVFPPVPFAPAYMRGLTREELRSKRFELFPPSLWVSGELCRLMYVELLESIADLGFKACIALGGHGPAAKFLRQITEERGGRIGDMFFFAGGGDDLAQEELKELAAEHPSWLGHGAMLETSMVMAYNPEWADPSRARRVLDAPYASQVKNWDERVKEDRLRALEEASEEVGKKVVAAMAKRVAAKARELLARAEADT